MQKPWNCSTTADNGLDSGIFRPVQFSGLAGRPAEPTLGGWMIFVTSPIGPATRLLRNALGLGAALVLLAAPLAVPASAAETTEVAHGLDNPRGLDFGLLGALYVAEAGKGGNGPCLPSPEGDACYGASGAVTRVLHGRQERIATGLPSMAGQTGDQRAPRQSGRTPSRPSSLATCNSRLAGGTALISARSWPRTRKTLRVNNFGRLLRLRGNGSVQSLADLTAFEHANNPDGAEENSDPFGLLGGLLVQYVADAGANDLLSIGPGGHVSTVATFPVRNVTGPAEQPSPWKRCQPASCADQTAPCTSVN